MEKRQLRMGKKVEQEHKDVYNFMKKRCKTGRCPSSNQVFTKIAQDHLKEDRRYYSKLKKAKL